MVRTPKIWYFFFEISANVKIAMQSFEFFWGEMPKCPPWLRACSVWSVVKSLNYFMLSATTRMNWAWLMIGLYLFAIVHSETPPASASWAKLECSPGETIRLSIIVVWTVSFGFSALWYFGSVVFLTSFFYRWRRPPLGLIWKVILEI